MITEFPTTPQSAQPHQQTILRLGYMPLTDAAPLLVAQEKRLFARHGVRVELSRHTAWAGLRDRIAGGTLDGAQMLAPMPLALALGLGGPGRDLSVVATLSRNGNTIVIGTDLMADIAAEYRPSGRKTLPANALAQALARRAQAGLPPPVFAVVFPFSSHNYLLRHWLATAGIVPERDVRLVVLPPSQVVESLADGMIAGFCAGEPWGSRAVELGVGHIAVPSSTVWPHHPEKVMAFAAGGDTAARVAATAALIEAGRWADDPANHHEMVQLLCRDALPGLPPELITLILDGSLAFDPWGPFESVTRMVFAETYPSAREAGWYLDQMRRWGHLPAQTADLPQIRDIWRPDLWTRAAQLLGIAIPDEAAFPLPAPPLEMPEVAA